MILKIVNTSPFDLPKYESNGASGLDLRANIDAEITLQPFERRLIPTGLFIEIPFGYEGQVRARSGISIKKGLTLINAVGTIDSDYRGEIQIPMVNLSSDAQTIVHGDRIAQIVFAKVEYAELIAVDSLEETVRGEGGFGSTNLQ